jgi:hypothetical protein
MRTPSFKADDFLPVIYAAQQFSAAGRGINIDQTGKVGGNRG